MKKFLTILVLVFATTTLAHAQFGIIGGYTLSNAKAQGWNDVTLKNMSQFHAGVAYRIKMGPFFVLQPELTYEAKGSTIKEVISGQDLTSLATQSGYVELGLAAQAGIDLLAVRPFIVAQPFVGYQVYGRENYQAAGIEFADINDYLAQAKNKFEWGFGVGGGIDLLNHLQFSVQWFMNIGQLFNENALNKDVEKAILVSDYKKVQAYQGVKFTLGIFF